MTAPHLAPGTVLNGRSYNFSIQALVGHSGSSSTFRALSSAGGESMVKLYDPAVRQRPDITSAMERVYAETMQLPGDVIVHVLEAGYDPATGSPFSATAFVQLPSIAQLVARRPLSPAEVTGMLKSMARGLDAAHVRGIAHHAIKPTNVFLGGAPNFEARITDFGAGLVRLAVPTHDGYAQSAPWLAPEQVQQGAQAGPAADIFSAALLAFYALTSRSFWKSCQGQSPDLNAWQQELFGGRAVASLRASEIGIPLNASLDPIFSRALSIDPAQRYRTIGELAAAFEGASSQQQAVGATLAFPAVDAAPPPPAQGQYAPAPAPAQAAAQAPTQVSPQQGQGAAGSPWGGGQGAAADPANMSGPTLPSADLNAAASAAAMTMVPGAAEGPRARVRTSKTVPIFLGITALLLVGGVVAAFTFLGDSGSGSGSGDTSAVTVPPPSGTPTASEAPSTAAPDPSASATATAEAAPSEVQLTIACVPGCDSVEIDGNKVEEVTKPTALGDGKHTLVATKEGYTKLEESIEVAITDKSAKVTFTKTGGPAVTSAVSDIEKPLEHKVVLALEPKAGTAPIRTPIKKPCKSKFGVGCK